MRDSLTSFVTVQTALVLFTLSEDGNQYYFLSSFEEGISIVKSWLIVSLKRLPHYGGSSHPESTATPTYV